MKRTFGMLLIGLLILSAPLFASGEQEAEGAKEYKTLHVYTAFDTEESQLYIEAFEKATGIDVEWVRMSAGELLARVEAESSNPQASVWFAGPNTSHIAANVKGLLEPYKPNVGYELASNFHADDYSWNGFYTGAIGFVSNKDFLAKNGLEAPTSWEDLLKPEYAAAVEMAYPYTSGTAYTTWATRIQMLGMDEALNWWEKFDKSIHQYTKSGSACIARAGLGECGVGISFSHDIMAKGVAKGYPVVISFPKEGTGYEVGAMSILKGAPEVEEAKIFIDWFYTTEAQNLFQEYFRLPVNPDADIAEGAIPLSDITLIDYDALSAGKNKEANVTAWRDRIGK